MFLSNRNKNRKKKSSYFGKSLSLSIMIPFFACQTCKNMKTGDAQYE